MRLWQLGINPSKMKEDILKHVAKIVDVEPRPHVLINTESGRLCNGQEQIEAFRAHPTFKELVFPGALESGANADWKETVQQYFRYSTFSHTWEIDQALGVEPEFRDLENR